MSNSLIVALGLLFSACSDKAKAAYDECRSLESSKKLEGALEACGRAIAADKHSDSGKKARILQDEISRVIEAEKRQQAAAVQQAVAEVATCKGTWVTFCTIDGRPSGGMLEKPTKAECEETAKGFEGIGMECAPCRCGSSGGAQ